MPNKNNRYSCSWLFGNFQCLAKIFIFFILRIFERYYNDGTFCIHGLLNTNFFVCLSNAKKVCYESRFIDREQASKLSIFSDNIVKGMRRKSTKLEYENFVNEYSYNHIQFHQLHFLKYCISLSWYIFGSIHSQTRLYEVLGASHFCPL